MRLERGVRLNHPESVALLSTWVIERAREGAGVADLMQRGREILTREQVMPDVVDLPTEVQVEATFPDGRKLVTATTPSPDDTARSTRWPPARAVPARSGLRPAP